MRPALALLSLLSAAAPASAQDDLFAFIPPGGRTIATTLLADEPEGAFAQALASGRGVGAWEALLARGDAAIPGAGALDDWERRTLADYLGYAGAVADPSALPRDGRDMVLADCQSCHIVTVVVTQARPREAWLGTLGKPSHVGVPLSVGERGQLADYLTVNAGIPIDQIPPELRAGGASY